MKDLSRISILFFAIFFSVNTKASESQPSKVWWDVEVIGVYQSENASAFIKVQNFSNPYPRGASQPSCGSRESEKMIYIYRGLDGKLLPEKKVDRMLALSIAGKLARPKLRVNVFQLASKGDNCYALGVGLL